MNCPTAGDHVFGEHERLVSSYVHPTEGRIRTFESRCEQPGCHATRRRVQREGQSDAPRSAYGLEPTWGTGA